MSSALFATEEGENAIKRNSHKRDIKLKEGEGETNKRLPSPSITDMSLRAISTLNASVSPRMRHRSASMKKPNIRPPEDYEMDEIRPRTSSLPTKNTYKKPNLLTIKATAGILYEDSENDFYRQRHFETTSKGGLVNRGDSLISRSTNSIVSSGSEICALSRTSSSVSQGSLGNDVSGKTYNVLMLGAQGVGKTALTQQFMTSEYLGGFDTSIDGDQEKCVSVLLDGEESSMLFHDNPFQTDFTHCECITAYVIVYSVDDRATFDRAVDLLYNIRKERKSGNAMILVGNKCELARARNISLEEAKSVATTYDCKFIETSTVLNHNVDQLLVGILSQIRLKEKQRERRGKIEHLHGCVAKSKQLLNKFFGKEGLSKSCENLYTL